MAKKQLPLGKNRNPNKNSKAPHKTKTKNSPKINAKNPSKITETANGDASREETELAIVPWSSVESENDEVTDTSEAEDDGVEWRSSSDEEEEEAREKKPKSVGKKGEKDDAKSKGKKRSRKGEDELEAEEKTENALYTFPMNRISRMIKRQIPDIKISQEVVFLINRASIHVNDGYGNLTDSPEQRIIQNTYKEGNNVRCILVEQSNNLVAVSPKITAPPPLDPVVTLPSKSSGSFPAVPKSKKPSPPPPPTPVAQEDKPPVTTNPAGDSGNSLMLIIVIAAAIFFLILLAVLFIIFRSRAARTTPWKTGLSGQLQKAFVTGFPQYYQHPRWCGHFVQGNSIQWSRDCCCFNRYLLP